MDAESVFRQVCVRQEAKFESKSDALDTVLLVNSAAPKLGGVSAASGCAGKAQFSHINVLACIVTEESQLLFPFSLTNRVLLLVEGPWNYSDTRSAYAHSSVRLRC